MQRDASTSTIGREERKPLMEAYMFQRRVLFCCSFLMVLSLIVWIVAISTDHWIIISGMGGIFIPETRRFFMSSHSGLWRHCRNTVFPYAQPESNVVRNFTTITYNSPTSLNEAKLNMTQLDFIKRFREEEVIFPLTNFTEPARRRMFAHWVRNDALEFKMFKEAFATIVIPQHRVDLDPIEARPISINPLDVNGILTRNTFGDALRKIQLNGKDYYFVIPTLAQEALFKELDINPNVPKLLYPFVRDLGVPPYVLNGQRVILQLEPPRPPKSGERANGYVYQPIRQCKYIDMFPNANALSSDLAFDETLMDYIRTQASFACITVFVMCLGAVFSFYTFMNPRYMFKRLAGGIHLVSASSAIVVLQVMFSSVDYTREHLLYAYPYGAELTYGYGVYLAWFTFAVNVLCGVMFMWYSGKKKGNKAPNDELAMADEPINMGR